MDRNKDKQSSEKPGICAEVMAYLSVHPDAQDTIEGIVQWWLLEQTIEHQTAVVREAIDHLVEKGLVEISVGPDSRKSYRVKNKLM